MAVEHEQSTNHKLRNGKWAIGGIQEGSPAKIKVLTLNDSLKINTRAELLELKELVDATVTASNGIFD